MSGKLESALLKHGFRPLDVLALLQAWDEGIIDPFQAAKAKDTDAGQLDSDAEQENA